MQSGHQNHHDHSCEMRDRGYTVVRGFLDDGDLEALRDDHRDCMRVERTVAGSPIDYTMGLIGTAARERIQDRIGALFGEIGVRASEGKRADLVVNAAYFDTQEINFDSFHQDGEPYDLYQSPVDYLNIWIPIVKPTASQSNLEVIARSSLYEIDSELADFVYDDSSAHYLSNPLSRNQKTIRAGARAGKTCVVEKTSDRERVFDVDYAAAVARAHCPHLEAGDALVLRGDTLHRTQDADTRRVAASIRMTWGDAPVNLSRMISGQKQLELMASPRNLAVVSAFLKADKEELRARDVRAAFLSRMELEAQDAAALGVLAQLTQQLRAGTKSEDR
jgi:ectoine hydroxylase-related dioxygenase (phytanoyl-CoA dioxygenase family)